MNGEDLKVGDYFVIPPDQREMKETIVWMVIQVEQHQVRVQRYDGYLWNRVVYRDREVQSVPEHIFMGDWCW